YWIRILNGESLRRKCLHWFERVAARAHQLPLLRPSRGVTCEIRGYAPTDLDRCQRLIETMSNGADLAMLWRPERLKSQLDWNGVPRTLVLDHGEPRFGLVNYHRFGLLGGEVVSAGLVDLLGSEGENPSDRRKLLRAAVAQMTVEGMDIAMAVRMPMFPAQVMLACGFLPLPQSEYLVYAFLQPGLSLPPANRPFILFR